MNDDDCPMWAPPLPPNCDVEGQQQQQQQQTTKTGVRALLRFTPSLPSLHRNFRPRPAGSAKRTRSDPGSNINNISIPSTPTPVEEAEHEFAMATLNTGILSEQGRRGYRTVCPHCQILIVTRKIESSSPTVAARLGSRYKTIFVGIIIFAIIILVKYSIEHEDWNWLIIGLPGIIFITGCLTAFVVYHNGPHCYKDVTHFCPKCAMKLGVNLGDQEYLRRSRGRPTP